jgi:hypothetical protein
MEVIADLASRSLMPKANTWYVGANVEGKPRVFSLYSGGFHKYRETCEAVTADGYRAFVFGRSPSFAEA